MNNAPRSARTEHSNPRVPTERGAIAVILGCMFSGKTTELLRRLDRFPIESTVTVKHVIDDRYRVDAVVSHSGKARSAQAVARAEDIPSLVSDSIELVAIDEAHFFGASLIEVLQSITHRGVAVMTTLLDRDSWGRPFVIAERLRDLADETLELDAICGRCGKRADRTQRLTPIVNGRMVGGSEGYEPRCPACWTPPL